jgi:hypothetical protein
LLKAWTLAAALLFMLPIGCQEPGRSRVRGDVLDTGDSSGLRIRKFPVGAQTAVMVAGAINKGDRPVTLRRVEVVEGRNYGIVGRVVDIQLAVDRDRRKVIPLGDYQTDPPVLQDGVTDRGEPRCTKQKVKPVAGYRLAPGEDVKFLIRVRAEGPGRMKIDAQQVVYELDGLLHRQEVPFGMVLWTKEFKRLPRLYADQRRCAHLVEVLPGWRAPDGSG